MKKNLPLVVALLLYFSSFSQSWMPKDPLPISTGLLSPVSFSISGALYVGGGYIGNNTNSDSFYRYTPATNTWTAMANLPVATESAYGFVLNGKGYMVCGYDGSNLSTAVYMYDPTTNTWTAKNNFPGSGRQNHACFSSNGKGYMFGGFVGGSSVVNEMWQYNDTTDTWLQMTSAPGPGRNNPAFLVINNQIYVGLGGPPTGNTAYADFYRFDPVANSYSPVDSIPEARSCVANFTLGNLGYVGLGLSINGSYLNDFYTFDPSTNTWASTNNFGGIARAHVYNEVVNGVPYVGCGDYGNGLYKSDNWSYGYPAGINNIANNASPSLTCFPSPTSTGFTINMSGYSLGERQISISDQLGQVVYQAESSQDEIKIDYRLSPGLYIISVKQDSNQEYSKVIVK